MGNLKQKTVSGVFWALIEKFGVYGTKLILGIILARILSPSDYGLIGMITVFFVIAEVFITSGFGMAYIQKAHVNDSDADTVFYTNLSISIILFIILFFTAPFIASFYNQPELIDLTRVMSFVLIINSFNIIQRSIVVRNVNFKKISKITITASFISGISGIFAAYHGYGPWSLVIQTLSNRFLITLGFWMSSSYRPGLNFSIQSFKEMFSFGSWLLASSLLRTFFDNIYVLIIGKVFPVSQLGYYSKAKQFLQIVSVQISSAIGSVAFPVYSRLQNNKEKLVNSMSKFIKYSMVLIIPMLLTLFVIADSFVINILTEKWAPMIPYMQLLCISGAFYPLNMINIQSITAQGKAKLSFRINLFLNLLRIINILITYRYGVYYILLGDVICSILAFVICSYFSGRIINYGFLKQLMDIKEYIVGAFVAFAVGYTFVNLDIDSWLKLIAGGLITFGTFFIVQYMINRKFMFELQNVVQNRGK